MTFLRICLIIASLHLILLSGIAQKPPIDSSVYGAWQQVTDGAISNNGKYVSYEVESQNGLEKTLFLKSTGSGWNLVIHSASLIQFSANSRYAVVWSSGDSLGIVKLGGAETRYFKKAFSPAFLSRGDREWLSFIDAEHDSALVSIDLNSLAVKVIPPIKNVWVLPHSPSVIVEARDSGENKDLHRYCWIDFSIDSTFTFTLPAGARNFISDDKQETIAFLAGGKEGSSEKPQLWSIARGRQSPSILIDGSPFKSDTTWEIMELYRFSRDGTRLFFSVVKPSVPGHARSDVASLDVWSYKDERLQSQQMAGEAPAESEAVVNIKNGEVLQLLAAGEMPYRSSLRDRKNPQDHWALIDHRNGQANPDELCWNTAAGGGEYVESTLTGDRQLLEAFVVPGAADFRFSPGGNFIVYYNRQLRDWFSYDLSTRTAANITKGELRQNIEKFSDSGTIFPFYPAVAGWIGQDSCLLLQDGYDLWSADLKGRNMPLDITNGYGRTHDISFEFAMGDNPVMAPTEKRIVLSAFDKTTKAGGFYKLTSGQPQDPVLLTMGQFYYQVEGGLAPGAGIIKARDRDIYLIKRMSCSESPNFFTTADFKNFVAVSSVYPERNYNWMRSELYTWRAPDGETFQGILYKPEDFDSLKEYPVIFHYYEHVSDRKNLYIDPDFAKGALNIAWYVSNGYLVFMPDIHYKIGYAGAGALKSVVSAATWLRSLPGLKLGKMGIQGMSFGGYETYYIVTHTGIFSAACAASGVTDLVSQYGELNADGGSMEGLDEWGQNRLGGPFAEKTEVYIRNSPIFHVRDVSTPLLMMHTKADPVCPFVNALEFYISLRRFDKKAWLLQYDDGYHALSGLSGIDFTIRMQQFFDYYLKERPAPYWMTKGIPWKMKGIDNGLSLDRGIVP